MWFKELLNSRVANFYIVLFLILSFFAGIFLYTSWNLTLIEQDELVILEISTGPINIERIRDYGDRMKLLNRKEIKGIYLTAYSAGNVKKMTEMVDLINSTELNAVVIDIKDYSGKVLYDSNVPLVNELGLKDNRIGGVRELISTLHEYGIYVIARQTVFQDPILTQKKPEWAIKTKSGGIWRDYKGLAWVDPTNKEVWDYNVAIAREAAKLGFDEINFDYVRFPSDGNMVDVAYSNGEKKKYEVMGEFFQYLNSSLSTVSARISLDMFGFVMEKDGEDDMSIGQRLEDAVDEVDAISPMMYPSHYPSGHLGLSNPADFPGLVIENGAKMGAPKFEGKRAMFRPWIQAFNLGAVYDAEKIRAQIDVVEKYTDGGWLMWNASNRYSDAGLNSVEIANPMTKTFVEILEAHKGKLDIS